MVVLAHRESIGAATPLNMADIRKSTAVLVKALFAEDYLGKHVYPLNVLFSNTIRGDISTLSLCSKMIRIA